MIGFRLSVDGTWIRHQFKAGSVSNDETCRVVQNPVGADEWNPSSPNEVSRWRDAALEAGSNMRLCQ